MASHSAVNHIARYVKMHQQQSGGHDWWHVYRVWQVAKFLGKMEGADLVVVQLAALLHDLADWKFHGATAQVKEADAVLKKFRIDEGTRRCVVDIVSKISFKGANSKNKMSSLEGYVVQDADRLDALGALGIARVFEYGGRKGRVMHNPTKKIKKFLSEKEYVKTTASSSATTLEHFYQKILLLKDRMNTKTGRRIAENRHKFLKLYLNEFHKEWKMKDISR